MIRPMWRATNSKTRYAVQEARQQARNLIKNDKQNSSQHRQVRKSYLDEKQTRAERSAFAMRYVIFASTAIEHQGAYGYGQSRTR